MILSLDGEGPLYRQVTRALRQSIERGDLVAGERLPGTRRLAADLGVSRNIVIMAFDQLVIEGYVESRVGSGTVVADTRPMVGLSVPVKRQSESADTVKLSVEGKRLVDAAGQALDLARQPGKARYNFEYGLVEPDATSQAQWRRLMAQSIATAQFDYGHPAGEPGLREEVAKHLNNHRGLNIASDNVVIVSGSQQALDLVARLFVSPGDRVLVEEPQYQGARQAFVAAGANLLPSPVDADGMSIPEDAGRIRVAYVTPSHQFPTGVVMPAQRRFELLRWAASHGTLIVEDDYDSEFRYDSHPVQALAGLRSEAAVVYVGTFAKSLFPGLRLGYLAAPKSIANSLTRAKWLTDRCCSLPLQNALATFMASGDYRRHLRRMSRRYSQSRHALVSALNKWFGAKIEIGGGQAGIHLTVWFPELDGCMEATLIEFAMQVDCAVYPVSVYYIDQANKACPGLIMGYSSMQAADIEAAVERLATAWTPLFER
ncbi:MAG: GntR family transcriptional regulator [Lysobacteraceae bacterium]|nr:MAG: GntR family transcriptional regulator [Xanthomonadaceae bacterium]